MIADCIEYCACWLVAGLWWNIEFGNCEDQTEYYLVFLEGSLGDV